MRVQARRQYRIFALGNAPRHADRLPTRGRAVVHRRIGNVAAEQPRHLRLELKQHLQRTLRNFGLVRRVGGQKLAALDQVIDAGRNMMLIRPTTEEKRVMRRRHIHTRQIGEMPLHRHFAGVVRQPVDRPVKSRLGGDVYEQIVDAVRADDAEHRLPVIVCKG